MRNFPPHMTRKKNSGWCLAMRHSPSENSDPLWVWDGAGVQFLRSFVHNTRGYGSFVFTHLSASSNKYHIKSKTFMHMDASLCVFLCGAHSRRELMFTHMLECVFRPRCAAGGKWFHWTGIKIFPLDVAANAIGFDAAHKLFPKVEILRDIFETENNIWIPQKDAEISCNIKRNNSVCILRRFQDHVANCVIFAAEWCSSDTASTFQCERIK
jgi:hypothetical protein